VPDNPCCLTAQARVHPVLSVTANAGKHVASIVQHIDKIPIIEKVDFVDVTQGAILVETTAKPRTCT